MKPYNQAQELLMMIFFSTLSEKEKRHYAAVESNKLTWGEPGQTHQNIFKKNSSFKSEDYRFLFK